MTIPRYLKGFETLYAKDPRRAALAWFRDARYGLFLHYGLYSLLGRHEWVQFLEKIRPGEYAKLARKFTASGFDADAITDLAVDAGMRYVNLTTRHHDGFCLFRTRETPFQSIRSPCKRDLVAELATACERRGLGLCLYYSHGRDWRHPHAPNNGDWGGAARPEYDPPEKSYAHGAAHDLDQYLEFMKRQITELLTQYGPVAAIWLDGIGVPLSRDPGAFRCQELYDHIHALQPQVLVSYKQGVTGTEDFFAPEHQVPDVKSDARQRGRIGSDRAKTIEVCTTMCPESWGYMRAKSGQHMDEGRVWQKLQEAGALGFNLLLNTGPLPDGSLDPEDTTVLRRVGARLRREGFPGTSRRGVVNSRARRVVTGRSGTRQNNKEMSMLQHQDIRIGTLAGKGKDTAQYIKDILPHGFESFQINFWQTLGGVNLVELSKQVKGVLEGSGAVISSLAMFGNPLKGDAMARETIRGWEKCIDAAHLFGCDIVAGFAGRVVDQPIDKSMPTYKRVFGPLAKRAADKGVRLAFENCEMGGSWERGDWNIAQTPKAWELMFDTLPSDQIGLCWEPCHQMVKLIDPISQLRKWVRKVFHVHGKDASILWDVVREHGVRGPVPFAYHRTPGFGDSNWTDIISILRMGGFKGSIDIEGWHDPVYRGELEMTGQVHGLNYLKQCRGGAFIPNPV